jgi:hypothetical protein
MGERGEACQQGGDRERSVHHAWPLL